MSNKYYVKNEPAFHKIIRQALKSEGVTVSDLRRFVGKKEKKTKEN